MTITLLISEETRFPLSSVERRKLESLFYEIICGYSYRKSENFGKFYIKHLTSFDSGDLEFHREQSFDRARGEGLPTEDEQVKKLIEEKLWSKDNEDRIRDLSLSVSNMRATQGQLILKSQKTAIQSKIIKSRKELTDLMSDRLEAVGYTAETFANKKASEFYVQLALKKDPSLKESFFGEEEFDELHDIQMAELVEIYDRFGVDFSQKNLKRIGLGHSFLSLFNLSQDDILGLFGVPVVKLSYFQVELVNTAKMLKSLISEAKHKPTDQDYRDPDSLLAWMESNSGRSNPSVKDDYKESSGEGGGVSYVGATEDDLRDMGVADEEKISLSKEAAKKGGKLNMSDMMKLHGVN